MEEEYELALIRAGLETGAISPEQLVRGDEPKEYRLTVGLLAMGNCQIIPRGVLKYALAILENDSYKDVPKIVIPAIQLVRQYHSDYSADKAICIAAIQRVADATGRVVVVPAVHRGVGVVVVERETLVLDVVAGRGERSRSSPPGSASLSPCRTAARRSGRSGWPDPAWCWR